VNPLDTEREKATAAVLATLRQPLALLSVPMRESAAAMASKHSITATDLLKLAVQKAKGT